MILCTCAWDLWPLSKLLHRGHRCTRKPASLCCLITSRLNCIFQQNLILLSKLSSEFYAYATIRQVPCKPESAVIKKQQNKFSVFDCYYYDHTLSLSLSHPTPLYTVRSSPHCLLFANTHIYIYFLLLQISYCPKCFCLPRHAAILVYVSVCKFKQQFL